MKKLQTIPLCIIGGAYRESFEYYFYFELENDSESVEFIGPKGDIFSYSVQYGLYKNNCTKIRKDSQLCSEYDIDIKRFSMKTTDGKTQSALSISFTSIDS